MKQFASIAMSALALAACGESEPAVTSTAEKEPASEPAAVAPTPIVVSADDEGRICRAAIGSVMGRDPSIISVVSQNDGITRVRYRRDDGTTWTNECKLRSSFVDWRGIEGERVGRWRTEDMISFELKGDDVIHIRQSSFGEVLDDADYTVR